MDLRILVVLCACAIPVLSGCAAPAAVVASVGMSAAQAGSSAWVNGELREAVFVDLETVHQASLRAMQDLLADIRTERAAERSVYVLAQEPGGPAIRITMARRTPTLTRIGVRVGLIGDLATSQIVLERIYANLPETTRPRPPLHE